MTNENDANEIQSAHVPPVEVQNIDIYDFAEKIENGHDEIVKIVLFSFYASHKSRIFTSELKDIFSNPDECSRWPLAFQVRIFSHDITYKANDTSVRHSTYHEKYDVNVPFKVVLFLNGEEIYRVDEGQGDYGDFLSASDILQDLSGWMDSRKRRDAAEKAQLEEGE